MKKNVAFLLDHLGVGGVQEFLLNYLRAMKGEQDVTIISIFSNDVYSTRMREAGAEVVFLTELPYGYSNIFNARAFLTFRRFIKERGNAFDDIHLKLFAAFLYASLLRLYKDSRVSAAIDCNYSQLTVPLRVMFWMFARYYKRFYLTSARQAEFQRLGLRAERVRHQRYLITRRRSSNPKKYPKKYPFLSVGRGIRQKGHAEAIRFFECLSKELDDDACLTIVGDGPAIDILKRSLLPSLESRIQFAGNAIDYDDWLVGASGLIKMAYGEGMHGAAWEAVLAGKPVATTVETAECQGLADKGLLTLVDRLNMAEGARRYAQVIKTMTTEATERMRRDAEAMWPDEGALDIYR